MQQTAQQSVGQMLSWDKFEIYPLNWSCLSEMYTALSAKNWNTAKRLPAGNQDG